MKFFNKEVAVVEEPKDNTTNDINITYLNGYGAIRKQHDEHNTLTVEQPVVANWKPKKVNIGVNGNIVYSLFLYFYIENYGSMSSRRIYWVQRLFRYPC